MISQLRPTNAEAGEFVANELGWANLRDLLIELGCDVSAMTDQADGSPVSADIAGIWGGTILDNLDRVRLDRTADRTFSGGERWELTVEGTLTPVEERTYIAGERRLAEALGRPLEPTPLPSSRTRLKDNREALAFVTKFAKFCLASGGFEQH